MKLTLVSTVIFFYSIKVLAWVFLMLIIWSNGDLDVCAKMVMFQVYWIKDMYILDLMYKYICKQKC